MTNTGPTFHDDYGNSSLIADDRREIEVADFYGASRVNVDTRKRWNELFAADDHELTAELEHNVAVMLAYAAEQLKEAASLRALAKRFLERLTRAVEVDIGAIDWELSNLEEATIEAAYLKVGSDESSELALDLIAYDHFSDLFLAAKRRAEYAEIDGARGLESLRRRRGEAAWDLSYEALRVQMRRDA